MQQLIDAVLPVYKNWKGQEAAQVDVLAQSGSDRRYFRVFDQHGNSVIATHGLNVAENETFIYFSEHFNTKGLNTPQILAVSEDKTVYLQEDFGNTSLLNVLEEDGFSEAVYNLFRESLHQLARLQIIGHE